MPEKPFRKIVDFQEGRLDRRGPRPAVKPPALSTLTGVDGQEEGVSRAFPGFVTVHEFSYAAWDLAVDDATGVPALYHNASSRVVDVFVRDFLVGERHYGVIIVHRVQRAGAGSTCDVFADVWISAFGGAWERGVLLKTDVPLPQRLDRTNGRQMDVVVFGHLVYVLIEGNDPILYHRRKTSPYTGVRVEAPGPGAQVELLSPVDVTAVGAITAPAGDETARGQVALLQYLPNETGLFPDWSYGSGSGTGSGSGDPDEEEIKWLEPGDYSFAVMLVDSGTGRRSSLSQIASARSSDFELGSGSGATAYSNLYAAVEILYETVRWDQAYVYRSVKLQDAGGIYVGNVLKLDRIVDLAEYQTVNNPGSVEAGYAQSVYWYELEDKPLSAQAEFSDFKTFDDAIPQAGAGLMYDGTLVLGKIRSTGAASTIGIRSNDLYKGATEIRWSLTLEVAPELFPPANRYVPSLPANEVITFQRVGPNIIGFSRDRQYLGRKEGGYLRFYEMLEGFGVINQRAAEPVGNLIYLGTAKGLKSVSADGQLEDLASLNHVFVSDWKDSLEEVSIAYDSLLSALFVMNATEMEGYVLWFNSARVTGLQDMGFEMVTRGPWPRDFVWDRDDLVGGGGGNATNLNPLEERAFFVENPPKETASETVDHYQFRLYMVDVKRQKTRSLATTGDDAATRYSMLPFEGDSIFEVQANFVSAGNATHRVRVDVSERFLGEVWGGWLYVLKAADKSIIGTKYRVKETDSPNIPGSFYMQEDPTAWDGKLVVGDVVGYSPVFMEGVGAPLGMESEEGYQFASSADYFRQRHIESVSVTAVGVQGHVATSETIGAVARFQGVLYQGAEETPVEVADTTDQNDALVESVVNGDGNVGASFGVQGSTDVLLGKFGRAGSVLCPGFRIFCPDLDYKILAMKVTGRVYDTDASAVTDASAP